MDSWDTLIEAFEAIPRVGKAPRTGNHADYLKWQSECDRRDVMMQDWIARVDALQSAQSHGEYQTRQAKHSFLADSSPPNGSEFN